MRLSIPRNFPPTNKMKKLPPLKFTFFITVCMFFAGCDSPKLKPPREIPQENKEQAEVDGIDREFARELAREFGRNRHRICPSIERVNNPVNFDFSKD